MEFLRDSFKSSPRDFVRSLPNRLIYKFLQGCIQEFSQGLPGEFPPRITWGSSPWILRGFLLESHKFFFSNSPNDPTRYSHKHSFRKIPKDFFRIVSHINASRYTFTNSLGIFFRNTFRSSSTIHMNTSEIPAEFVSSLIIWKSFRYFFKNSFSSAYSGKLSWRLFYEDFEIFFNCTIPYVFTYQVLDEFGTLWALLVLSQRHGM